MNVLKFGGTSVGSLERIAHVADKIIQTKQQGHQVVVVSSAMNGDSYPNLALERATLITGKFNLS